MVTDADRALASRFVLALSDLDDCDVVADAIATAREELATHTTTTAACYLSERDGIPTPPGTVRQWCNRRQLVGTRPASRKGEWLISQAALDSFVRPCCRWAARDAQQGMDNDNQER